MFCSCKNKLNKCHEIYLEQKFTQIEKKTKNYEEELEQVHTNRITTPSASNNRQQQHVIKVYVHSTIVFELFRKKKKHFFFDVYMHKHLFIRYYFNNISEHRTKTTNRTKTKKAIHCLKARRHYWLIFPLNKCKSSIIYVNIHNRVKKAHQHVSLWLHFVYEIFYFWSICSHWCVVAFFKVQHNFSWCSFWKSTHYYGFIEISRVPFEWNIEFHTTLWIGRKTIIIGICYKYCCPCSLR